MTYETFLITLYVYNGAWFCIKYQTWCVVVGVVNVNDEVIQLANSFVRRSVEINLSRCYMELRAL